MGRASDPWSRKDSTTVDGRLSLILMLIHVKSLEMNWNNLQATSDNVVFTQKRTVKRLQSFSLRWGDK